MTLEELSLVAQAHAEATAVARAATDVRAVAAYRARTAGATLSQLAGVLKMARPNVVTLVRRGAELASASAVQSGDLVATDGVGQELAGG